MSKFLTVEKLKFGDLLIQTNAVFEEESKFVIFVKVVEGNQLYHVHIDRVRLIHINLIEYFRKPYKQELTKEIIKQYKTALLKLSLERII